MHSRRGRHNYIKCHFKINRRNRSQINNFSYTTHNASLSPVITSTHPMSERTFHQQSGPCGKLDTIFPDIYDQILTKSFKVVLYIYYRSSYTSETAFDDPCCETANPLLHNHELGLFPLLILSRVTTADMLIRITSAQKASNTEITLIGIHRHDIMPIKLLAFQLQCVPGSQKWGE